MPLEHEEWAEVADKSASQTVIVEWKIDLKEKLAGLPERTQQVVWLLWMKYTWNEIAEKLGITARAARWAYHSCPDDVKRHLRSDP